MNQLIKLPEWKNLVEAVKGWNYGSVHTFDEIENILTLQYGTSKFNTHIARANKELTPMGKRLKNVRGIGYEVLNPNLYLEEAVHHAAKGANQIRKSYDIITNCPIALVDAHKRPSFTQYKDWIKSQFVERVSDVSTWVQIAKNPENIPKLPVRK